MKGRIVKVLTVVGLSASLVLQLGAPQAQASWGAYKFFNSTPMEDTTPQVPDTSGGNGTQPNQDTGNNDNQENEQGNSQENIDSSRLLRDKSYRWAVYNSNNSTIPPKQNDVQQPAEPQTPPDPTPPPAPGNGGENNNSSYSQAAIQMLEWVNQERAGRGLKPLTWHSGLADLAAKKSQEMVARNYISHTSPTMGSFAKMVYDAGIPFRQVGENVASTSTVKKAHILLMASEGHRNNLLSPSYTHMGIGIEQSRYGVVVTQLFIAQ